MHLSFHHKLLYLIGKIFNKIILVPHPDSIGNASEEIYFATLKARKENKKLAIIFVKKIPFFLDHLGFYDINFFNLKSKYFVFSHNSFFQKFWGIVFSIYFVFSRIIHSFLTKFFDVKKSGYYWRPMAGNDTIWRPDPNLLKFDIEIFKKQKWNEQLQYSLDIDLTDKVNFKCKEIFRSLGYDKKEFVCIHARDGGYKKDFPTNSLNVNIENYASSIEKICKNGTMVFRLGDPTMVKLPSIDNFIDYPFVDYKSPEMDIYLIKNCKFIICMGSGPFAAAKYLFQKEMLFVNHAQFLIDMPFNKESLTIFKQPFSRSKQRYLSLKELLLSYKDVSNKWWIGEDIEMKENNEQEILESTIEMLNKDKNNLPTALQEEFRKYYFNALNYWVNHFRFSDETELENCNEWYRQSVNMFYWNGQISNIFLQKNWNENSRNI